MLANWWHDMYRVHVYYHWHMYGRSNFQIKPEASYDIMNNEIKEGEL